MYTRVHVYMCTTQFKQNTHTFIYMHIYIHIHIHVHVHTLTHTHTHAHTRTRTHTCTHKHMHTHTHTHTHTCTHTHTRSPYSLSLPSLVPTSANILLDDHCVPKLSDFGLARELQAKPNHKSTYSTQSKVVMGTLAYMAPEFLRNRKMTTKTDVYSFGVVLLELFTGMAADDPSLKQRTLVGRGRG